MSLLTPDSGLLFWMLITFGIVFFVLAKYGFPVITKMVEDRKNYIQGELEAAKEAKLQVESVREEIQKIHTEARNQQMLLIKEGTDMREKLIEEAKQVAQTEANKIIQNAHLSIQKEKEIALQDIQNQVAQLSLDIAAKVLRKNLDNQTAQIDLINKLLDDAKSN